MDEDKNICYYSLALQLIDDSKCDLINEPPRNQESTSFHQAIPLKAVCHAEVTKERAVRDLNPELCNMTIQMTENTTEQAFIEYVTLGSLGISASCYTNVAVVRDDPSLCAHAEIFSWEGEPSDLLWDVTPGGCLARIYRARAIRDRDYGQCDEVRSQFSKCGIVGTEWVPCNSSNQAAFRIVDHLRFRNEVAGCYGALVAYLQDVSICERIKAESDYDMLDWGNQQKLDWCKQEVEQTAGRQDVHVCLQKGGSIQYCTAQRSKPTVLADCEQEGTEHEKLVCYLFIAFQNRDENICNDPIIDGNRFNYSQYCQNLVYFAWANTTKDVDYCHRILGSAITDQNPTINGVNQNTKKMRADCYLALAGIEKLNPLIKRAYSLQFMWEGQYG